MHCFSSIGKWQRFKSFAQFPCQINLLFPLCKIVRGVTSTKAPTPAARITSPHFLTSKTSIASKVTSSSPVTSSTTQTLKVTSSPVVQTTSSTQAWGMASSSYVISMILQTPEVTHLSAITPTTDTLRKKTPRGKSWTSTTEVPPKTGRKKNIIKRV